MIQFFNTFSGKLEEFKPVKDKQVLMYACGPTVYDYAHIGNFRTFVFEDLLRRFLEFKGYQVNHVMNVTDVDDKTIAGAQKEGKSLSEFTQKYLDAFNEDLKTLNILPPTQQPRATAEIPAMVEMIKKLIKNGAAYEKDNSVYYRVASFPKYGKLSKKDLKGNIKGARVDLDEYDKEEGSDFALWKKAKENEPSWDSPWGKGRPGWHIECSVMSMKYLGETFDIHAGGEDLIFPHHENEIAQSEATTGKPFVNYWLHSKHLLVNGEKMSKSKGNFYTLRDLLKKGYDAMAIRYALLLVHYRQQLNFTLDGLKEAEKEIKKLDDCYFQCLSRIGLKLINTKGSGYSGTRNQRIDEVVKHLMGDLNVSAALSAVSSGINQINAQIVDMDQEELQECVQFFEKIDAIFGFGVSTEKEISNDVLNGLLKLQDLRKEKKFSEADKIREKFNSKGWFVKDGRPGELSTVKKKRRTWDK